MCLADHDVSFFRKEKMILAVTSVVRVIEAQEIFEIALIRDSPEASPTIRAFVDARCSGTYLYWYCGNMFLKGYPLEAKTAPLECAYFLGQTS